MTIGQLLDVYGRKNYIYFTVYDNVELEQAYTVDDIMEIIRDL